jgi:hypothetical protein
MLSARPWYSPVLGRVAERKPWDRLVPGRDGEREAVGSPRTRVGSWPHSPGIARYQEGIAVCLPWVAHPRRAPGSHGRRGVLLRNGAVLASIERRNLAILARSGVLDSVSTPPGSSRFWTGPASERRQHLARGVSPGNAGRQPESPVGAADQGAYRASLSPVCSTVWERAAPLRPAGRSRGRSR